MLTVSNLNFSYSYIPILKNINFSIKGGELLHLVGQNGSGKSTIIKIISGQLPLQRGKILWQISPQDFTNAIDLEYLAPENNALFKKLDALQNLRFWANLRALDANDVFLTEHLKHWGLSRGSLMLKLPVEKYSTGMRRRLALARLALSPAPLWLLDEPLYGLDEEAVGLFIELLREHLKMGKMALLVSHETNAFTALNPNYLSLK